MPRYTKTTSAEAYREFNTYAWRLSLRLREMAEHKEKWYKVGKFWIHTETYHELDNPEGRYKWKGWEIVGENYFVEYYTEENIDINDRFPIKSAAEKRMFFTDKNEANECFKQLKKALTEMAEA